MKTHPAPITPEHLPIGWMLIAPPDHQAHGYFYYHRESAEAENKYWDLDKSPVPIYAPEKYSSQLESQQATIDRLKKKVDELEDAYEDASGSAFIGADTIDAHNEKLCKDLDLVKAERDALAAQLAEARKPARVKLPKRRYLKDRSISDDTYSEHSEGYDDALCDVREVLRAAGVEIQ